LGLSNSTGAKSLKKKKKNELILNTDYFNIISNKILIFSIIIALIYVSIFSKK